MTNELKFKLKPDIQIARLENEIVVLVGAFDFHPLRFRGASSRLIDLLRVGCSRQELCDHLQGLGYKALDVQAQVDPFLQTLKKAQALELPTEPALKSESSSPRILNIDPLAFFFARPFLSFPCWLTRILVSVPLVGALTIIAVTHLEARLLPSLADFSPLTLLSIFGIVPCALLHELSHAIACRAVGFPVTGLWIKRNKCRLLFFVDTRHLALSSARWPKVSVALAGPFMDVILLGSISLVLLICAHDSTFASSLRLLFLALAIAFYLNLNPWRTSDGSSAVCALMGDPLFRIKALAFKVGQKRNLKYFFYRLSAIIYLLIPLSVIGYCMWRIFFGSSAMHL